MTDPTGTPAPQANGSAFELETIPVGVLAGMAAPYNPRKINDHDMAALRRSLRFFGAVEPIVVNRRSQRIVGGHQRVKAAEAEGLDALPVAWVDLDDPSEKQLNLALNRISGEWDDAALRELLQGLDAEGADLELTGFDADEIAALCLPPEFRPEGGSTAGFDQRKPVQCPGCGLEFNPE